MPRWILYVTLILVALSWIPFAWIARTRATKRPVPRVQIIPDMDQQQKFRPQEAFPLFADTRADRRPVAGTVPHRLDPEDPVRETGMEDGSWVRALPVPVTESLLHRGRERYDIYCSACHGLSGRGDGIVARRADRLEEGTWTPPSSLLDETVRGREAGHLYNTIVNGIRNMPAYGAQISVGDRWAIVAYIRALQRAGAASIEDVPPEIRPGLR